MTRFHILPAAPHPWRHEIVLTRAEILALAKELEGDDTNNGFIFPLEKLKR